MSGAPRAGRSGAFALVAFAFVVTMLGTTLPTPLYPLFQQRFGFDNLVFTVIYAVYAGGVIAALVLFGRLSDRAGRRRVLLLALALSAASAAVFVAADGLAALVTGRVLSGLSAGVMTGTATAALMDLAPQRRPGRASLVAAAANMGGLGLGPLLAGALADYAPAPTRLCFLTSLALVIVATAGVAFVPDTGVPVATGPLVRLPRVPAGTGRAFVAAAVPGFAGFAVLGLFAAVAGPLLAAVVPAVGRLPTGLLAGTGFAASLAGQALSTRASPRAAMRYGCLLLTAGALLVVASLTVTSLPLLVGAAMAAGTGQGLSFRAGLATLTAATPPDRRAEVASGYFTILYIALSIPVIGCGAGALGVGWVRSATVFAALVGLLPLVGLAVQPRRRAVCATPAVARPAAPRPGGARLRRVTPLPVGRLTAGPQSPLARVPARPAIEGGVWVPPPRQPTPAPVPLGSAPRRLALTAGPDATARVRTAGPPTTGWPPLPPPWHLPPQHLPPAPEYEPSSSLPHPWRRPPRALPASATAPALGPAFDPAA